MPKRPWDRGTWRCEACGEAMLGERGEPPLDHVHNCEDATGESLVFEEDDGDAGDGGQPIDGNSCDLCGDKVGYLHSITSEPGLPTGMQSRLQICSGCRDAIEAADGDECSWCGSSRVSTVTVVGTSQGDYNLGRLCLDCQGIEDA